MIFPIGFSIPEEKIVKQISQKEKLVSDLIPGKLSTYIYINETDYYKEYQISNFAHTMKKGGWDCLRHYEILANGCLPVFKDIENCPPQIMTFMPKHLLIEIKNKFYSGDNLKNDDLINQCLSWTRENLTTEKMALYLLKTATQKKIDKVLFLSRDTSPDYQRCLTLHGLKIVLGKNCYDYPRIPHLYKDFKGAERIYGKGITYSKLLEVNMHEEITNVDILNKKYDLVIYGSAHRGMPFYDKLKEMYKPEDIILICGEDEHNCSIKDFSSKGHKIFIRELA
jgi:hypothetical protein